MQYDQSFSLCVVRRGSDIELYLHFLVYKTSIRLTDVTTGRCLVYVPYVLFCVWCASSW